VLLANRDNNRRKEASMNRRPIWLLALLVVTLLVAACGPQMSTPTAKAPQVATPGTSPEVVVPTGAPTAVPTAVVPTVEPVDAGKLPVDENDWHALGAADAAITLVEYSDFQ